MGIFDRFPYSSTHEMNLDFMLGKATEIAEDMQQVTAGMEQVQAGLSAISEKTEQATQAAAQAAQSASSIEGSVTAAEEAAEEAQMHNESAQTWANNALTYKADCQRAATEAAASSSSAAQAATAAAASEDTIAQYAQAANASAQSAANNNDSAHQYANQASASASNATFHSSNAQTAATNANTSATNAQTAATNAQTAATRAATLKDDCQTLHSMCTTAVDLAGEQAVAAANSAAQAAATKTDVETLVESLPEDFTDLNNTVNQLSDEIDSIESRFSGGGLNPDGNVIVEENATDDAWFNGNTGIPQHNQYTSPYLCTDFIPVEPSTLYQLYIARGNIYNLCQYNENKTFIAGTQSGNYPRTVTTDATARYIRLCLADTNGAFGTGIVVAIKGTVKPTEYIAPSELPVHIVGSDYATKSYVDARIQENHVELNLPERYEIVVGDIFQLFWKGVITAVKYEEYFPEVVCDIGINYTRFFDYKGAQADIGTHTMTVKLYDNTRNLVDEKTVNLIVKDKATSPVSEKVVLYVTDSLGNNGYVPDEFYRRLCGTGGSPAGDGLSNIAFIGTNESTAHQIKYVGNGGWTWATYNASMSTNAYMWITASHSKTIGDQHSVYKASNNTEWKLETIESGRIKIIRTSGSSELPSTGTLTWISGGENQDDIVYSASEQASGNPFWSESQNKISFSEFVQSQGKSSLDYVYVLLGWNGTNTPAETTKSYIRTFLNNVLADYPNCQIVILGIEIPARDGLANNYGQNIGVLSSYQQAMQYAFGLNTLYEGIAKETAYENNVSFVQISGQFDTEYNMPESTVNVNIRNNKTLPLQINGVHPAEPGYYQIADACYRDFVHKLQA